MKSTDANFIAEKNKASNKPIWLYTIYDYDGASTDLHFAEWDSDITFDGITYTRFPIKHDFISSNTSGQVDTLQVTVANVNRILQQHLETYSFSGKKVSVKIIFLDKIAEATAFLKDVFYIDGYSANAESVTFRLSSKFDILNLELPNRRYMRSYCGWKFKGTECAYAGATTSCNKTAQACKAMTGGSNYLRFGAFPSIPTERLYVA